MVGLLLPLDAPVASLDELDPAAAAEELPPGAGVQSLDGAHHFGASCPCCFWRLGRRRVELGVAASRGNRGIRLVGLLVFRRWGVPSLFFVATSRLPGVFRRIS